MKVYANLEEMMAALRGKIKTIELKEAKPKKKATPKKKAEKK